jgi:hypothetical protein
VIIDLRDDAPPTPAERRRGRYTLLICLALAVGLFAACLGFIGWLRWHSDESLAADRARGESLLAAIVLPQQWQRGPVDYQAAHLFWSPSSWAQQIATGTADPTAAQATLASAMQAASWTLEADCGSPPDQSEIDCNWLTDGYRLNSHTEPGAVTLRIVPWTPPRRRG